MNLSSTRSKYHTQFPSWCPERETIHKMHVLRHHYSMSRKTVGKLFGSICIYHIPSDPMAPFPGTPEMQADVHRKAHTRKFPAVLFMKIPQIHISGGVASWALSGPLCGPETNTLQPRATERRHKCHAGQKKTETNEHIPHGSIFK